MVRIKYVTIAILVFILQSCSLTNTVIRHQYDSVYNSVVFLTTDFIDEDDDIVTAAATGVVININYSKNLSYVLTVKHFCDVIIENTNLAIGKSDYKALKLLSKSNDKAIEFDGNLFYLDRDYDICIIELNGTQKLLAISVANKDVETGMRVHVIGAHARIFPVKFDGYVIADFAGSSCTECITISVPTTRGSSGSPVYNDNGELVGLILGYVHENNNLSIMQSLKSIKSAIEKSRL